MMMNRQEKQNLIKSLKQNFESSQASFLINVKGLTVEEVKGLRKNLRTEKGILKVAKNTLFKKATENLEGINALNPFFKEQIGVVFANQDSPAVAKILFQTSQTIGNLALIAGSLDRKLINKEQIEFLASLPSKEVLLGRVAGTLNMPIVSFVTLLHQLIQRLLWALKKIEEQKNS
jgi:large subunit ribosomal protein L10